MRAVTGDSGIGDGMRDRNESSLRRALQQYSLHYHEDRTHLGLGKGTPNNRSRAAASGPILVTERLAGLHHRYDRAA